jgi:25S rRNA (uracil2843-N3)-methyltransferase
MGQFDRKAQSQPKHGKPSSSGASKAPLRPNNGTPEWKGPGYIPKKKSTAGPTASSAQEPFKLDPTLPLELEQRMLEVFRATFPASSDFGALKPILYKVNDALLRKDLEAAFAEEEHLEAYAIRWSPSRALGYAQLLAWICAERADDACIQQLISSVPDQTAAKVVCFGGGAAEIMAFSGLLRHSRPSEAAGKPSTPATTEVSDSLEALKTSTTTNPTIPLLHLSHVDIANWTSVLSKLEQGLNTPPVLSKYASATARATNASFLSPGIIDHSFTRADILNSSTEDLRSTIGSTPALLTLLSTLNDLYTTSMPRTTAFLKKLTEAAPQGSLLLVVDAPGAHTEVTVSSAEGEEEKRKYPMNLLLDFALVPKASAKKTAGRKGGEGDEEARPKWEKILEKSSLAYRLRDGLRYPGSLENLRFQVHLFRRL